MGGALKSAGPINDLICIFGSALASKEAMLYCLWKGFVGIFLSVDGATTPQFLRFGSAFFTLWCRKREREGEREGARERESVCVYVCSLQLLLAKLYRGPVVRWCVLVDNQSES